MWEFNEVDRDNNYLAHASGHKYIRKDWKHGRWVYVYSDRFQQWPKVAERVRTAYEVRKEREARKQKQGLDRRLISSWRNSHKLAEANRQKTISDTTSRVTRASKTSREGKEKLKDYTRNINQNFDKVTSSRASKKLADRGIYNKANEVLAEAASKKSKKSLKRKAKKAYYKTRDAVRSIPSPINTHKVYKAGNRTTVVDERGPLISTKSNRKNRKKKRG